MLGHGVGGESLYLPPSAQLFCEPETALKKKGRVGVKCEGLQ